MSSTHSTKVKVDNAPGYSCAYCSKAFKSERTLMVHACVGKQRELERDEKHVRLGLLIYRKFYDFHVTKSKKGEKTWGDFMKSRYYNDFVKVGRYLNEINAVNASRFIEFLVRSGLPIQKWTSPLVYETYIGELTKKETPDAAVERNLLLMQQWAVDTQSDWRDFFRKVSPAQATLWIKTGRISPWVMLLCQSFETLLARLSPEQLMIVSKYLDPEFWEAKMAQHQDDVEYLRAIFAAEGV